jgi:hypothetical protein
MCCERCFQYYDLINTACGTLAFKLIAKMLIVWHTHNVKTLFASKQGDFIMIALTTCFRKYLFVQCAYTIAPFHIGHKEIMG